ncbi:MAG: hypothetical protein ACYC3F_15795 [Gemmatimonadaceae bacterium]
MKVDAFVRRHSATAEHWLFALVAFLVIAVAITHDYWRDEYQVWLISRDAASPLDLWTSLRFEGHPPLYYLLIWPLAHLDLPPTSMKLVVVPACAGTLWLVYTRLQGLPALGRMSVCLSAVLLQSVLAQPYALIALLLLASEGLANASESRADRRLYSWVCLGLAAATDLHAAVVGGILALDRLSKGSREYPGALVALGLAVLGVSAAYPHPAAQSVFASLHGSDPFAIFDLIARVPGPLASQLGTTGGCVVFLLVVPVLNWRERALLGGAIIALLPIALVSGATQSRHALALFVLVVILLSRAGQRNARTSLRPHPFGIDVASVSAAFFLGISLLGGVGTLLLTAFGEQSMANNAASAVRPVLTAKTKLIASPDFLGSAFAAELDRQVWTPECDCLTGAVVWTRDRNFRALNPDQMRARAMKRGELWAREGAPVLLILPSSAPVTSDWTLLGRWTGGRHSDEDVAVWQFTSR